MERSKEILQSLDESIQPEQTGSAVFVENQVKVYKEIKPKPEDVATGTYL